MTKITITIVTDAVSRNGRVIGARVITDDDIVNNSIDAPYIWQKTFPRNATMKEIRKDMVSNIKATVRNIETRVKREGFTGRSFEVET